MAEIVYFLCAILSMSCAFLLFRGYRRTRTSLLLWSSVCFGLLAANNLILFVDLVILPDLEFNGIFWRNVIGAFAGGTLLYGLIWELT